MSKIYYFEKDEHDKFYGSIHEGYLTDEEKSQSNLATLEQLNCELGTGDEPFTGEIEIAEGRAVYDENEGEYILL
jgi:hypothetical protein